MEISGTLRSSDRNFKWKIGFLEDGKVTFVYKDYRDGRKKRMTLPVFEFLRRFLQHVLPSGFHKARYYGFFSPGRRKEFFRIRMILFQSSGYPIPAPEEKKVPILACTNCGSSELRLIEVRLPLKRAPPQKLARTSYNPIRVELTQV
ncbi:MAG: transposase [Candidatus Riflebacteria bacterium]|nr:transposase [Candidatus Riflebacteria bacterium]